uniref:Auxin response factor 1 n=1 Tax=Tanacetum cinerariifolium TaxID=118510 RepID=A0A699H561_TANCI|nr:auxin response factor 1 [Tanacetum cinerariifolium]
MRRLLSTFVVATVVIVVVVVVATVVIGVAVAVELLAVSPSVWFLEQLWLIYRPRETRSAFIISFDRLPQSTKSQALCAAHVPSVPEPPCCNVCEFYKRPHTSEPDGLRKHTYLSVLATTHHAITSGTHYNVIYKKILNHDC